MRARTLTTLALAVAALALAPAGALAATGYIVNCGCTDTVSIFDSATRTVGAEIPVGADPFDVAVTRNGAVGYVTNNGEDTVSIVVAALGSSNNLIQVGENPTGVALSPDDGTLYVVNLELTSGNPTLSIVDTATRAVTRTVALTGLDFPTDAAISPDGHTLYVVDQSLDAVGIIDLTAPTPTPNVVTLPASDVNSLAVSPTTGDVYVTDLGGDVIVLDPAGNVIDTVAVGDAPFDVALDRTGSVAWVSDIVDTEVSRLPTATLVPTLSSGVGTETSGIAVSPDGDGVFVADEFNDRVAVLDPATGVLTAWIDVADAPSVIAFGREATPPPAPAIARPIVTDVSPRSGPVTGGERITIRGANFGSARAVLFGDTPASNVEVVDFNTIVVTAPPGLVGDVDVVVIGPGGESIKIGTFRYEAVPAPPPPPIPLVKPACVVPDVRGLSLAAARTRLTRANCIVGFTRTVRGARNQVVKRQSLTPGTRMPNGWGVALALGPRRG